MMITLLLLLFNPNTFICGEHRIEMGGADTFVIHAPPDVKSAARTVNGRVISILRDGVLYQKGGQLYFQKPAEATGKAMPAVDAVPLMRVLPNMDDPCFMDTKNLYIHRDGAWHRYDLPVWTETVPPRDILNADHGYRLLFPDLIQVSREVCWVYQAKTGVLTSIYPGSDRTRRDALDRKLVPLVCGARVLWIGVPKGDEIGLNRTGGEYDLVHHVGVKHLSRYALTFTDDSGCWLLTFPDGLTDGLEAWNEGVLPITATRIVVRGDRLEKHQIELGALPVAFALSASASGSPKLDVSPRFEVIPILGSSDLVLLSGGQARELSIVGLGQPHPGPNSATLAVRRGDKLEFH